MGIRKAMLAAALLVGIICSGFNYLHCEEEFPEWVPEEVIQKAKEILFSEKHDAFTRGLTEEELKRRELKYPYLIAEVDYVSFIKGTNIKEYLKKLRFSDKDDCRYGFGFGVYLDNKWIATLEVGYLFEKLSNIGTSKIMPGAEDVLALIYTKYPPTEGYKIIRDYIGVYAFFIEKSNKIIQAITYIHPEGIVFSYPEQHMLEEKKKIIEHRKFHSDPNLDNK